MYRMPMKHQRVGPAGPASTSSLDQATRQQILTVAEAHFLAKGYKGVSIKEIADAVQVMPSALYYYFPKGKEELFVQMFQALFAREVTTDHHHLAGTHENLQERLLQLTTDLLALPLDRLPLLVRDATEHLKDPEHQRVVMSLHEAVKRRIVHLFHAAQAAGTLRTDLPVAVLVLVYLGALKEAKGSTKPLDPSQLISILLDGMASVPGRAGMTGIAGAGSGADAHP